MFSFSYLCTLIIYMAYIETKTIQGKEYMYLRHSIRQRNGRVKHKTVKYMGPVKPIYKAKRKRKDNSWIFARKLTEKEKTELKKQTRNVGGFTKDRAKDYIVECRETRMYYDSWETRLRRP